MTITIHKNKTLARIIVVLLIVVDQFRYDYLERFGDLFGSGGFKRLMNEGALFTNANYDYVPTFTACGHAAISSGSVPALNSIVGNSYFDRQSGKVRVIVADDSAHLVTGKATSEKGGAPSPRTLIGTTIGDQMRLANNFQSKVVTASLKDRSAVLPGGHRPNGAFWFSEADGEFVSSDYYFKEIPAWVRKFDAGDRVDKYFGMKWERVLPAEAYKRAQAENLPLQRSSLGSRFPYVVTGGEERPGQRFYNAFTITPFFGVGVRAGRYNAECSPSDIAPTLSALLGVEPPSNRTGRVLVEGLAPPIQGNAGAI